MQTAQSTHLQNFEYDTNSSTVTITFQNGAVYQYPGVSPADYQRLVQSGGSGTAFWAFIRGKYTATKIVAGAQKVDRRGTRRNQG